MSNLLYTKIAHVMGEVGRLAKGERNEHFNYKFVGADAVYDAARKALSEQGVAIFSSMTDAVQEQIESSTYDKNGVVIKKRVYWHTRAKFVFVLADGESGESMACEWWAESNDDQDKGINKCATAALKYWLLKTLMISTGDDPDGDPGIDSKPAQRKPAPSASPAAPKPPAPEPPAQPRATAPQHAEPAATVNGDELLSAKTLPQVIDMVITMSPDIDPADEKNAKYHAGGRIKKALGYETKAGWNVIFNCNISVADVFAAVEDYIAAEENANLDPDAGITATKGEPF